MFIFPYIYLINNGLTLENYEMYCHRYATLDPIILETLLIECAEDVIYEQIPDVAVSQSSSNIVAVSDR